MILQHPNNKEKESLNDMKIVCLGDTHGKHSLVDRVPADMVIFTGDFMGSGYDYREVNSFLYWLSDYPARYKIMIAGNHDRFVENNPGRWRRELKSFKGITYLEDESTEIEGFKIYGTPHTKLFCNWGFNRTHEELKNLYGKIPDDTNILVTHGPRYGVLDRLESGEHVGEKELNANVERLLDLQLHCFGHIHCAHGVENNGRFTAANCAVVDDRYNYTWGPQSFYKTARKTHPSL